MQNPDALKSETAPGTQLRASDVNTAIIHLYRAEIARANSWRSRLDVTTNWALLSTAAAISFAFSQTITHHSVIILNTLLITLFLFIESRRYRYYELWSYRIRLMETDFYAALLTPYHTADPDWANKLAESLLHPQFPISNWEALGRRLRRNYLWIYAVLLSTWFAKLLLYPQTVESWEQLVTRARMGVAPGWLVMGVVLAFYVLLVTLALATRRLRQAAGEVFPYYGESIYPKHAAEVDPQMQSPSTSERRYPLLAIISTGNLPAVEDSIKAQYRREVQQLDPKHTTGTRTTLIVPVIATEVPALKALVNAVDEGGVVVVVPADELFAQER